MKNYKLFDLLRSIDKKEVTAFSGYIKQHYRNEKVAQSVFIYFKKFYPTFDDEKKMDIAYAYQKIFNEPIDKDNYNRKKILNALSDLHLWLKEYLLVQKIKDTKTFESQALWLMVLQERGLDKEFSILADRLKLMVGEKPRKNVLDYLKGVIADYFFYYRVIQSREPDVGALQTYGNDLDLFYLVTRLKVACEMANLKNLRNEDLELGLLPAALELGKAYDIAEYPLPMLYYKVYQLIADNQADSYAEIKTMLSKNADKIEAVEMHVILSYLHNHAAAQIREGKEEFWEESHNLNKFGLEHGVFMESDVMSPTQFNNIVNIACKVAAFAWAQTFIKSHHFYLPPDIRSTTVALSEAIVLFEQKEFRKALTVLKKIKNKDVRQAIRTRTLIIRCNYELMEGEDFELFDYCNSFEVFLRRSRSSNKEIVEATLNFVRLLKLLLRMRMKKNKVVEEIMNASPIYFKPWLLEKAEAYEAKYAARK